MENEIEIISTTKGKPCAAYNGYLYRQRRINKSGETIWLCLKEKNGACPGKIFTKNSLVTRSEEHICIPDGASIEVRKAIFKAKKRAREEDQTSIAKIYSDEFDDISRKGYEFVTKVPTYYGKSNLKIKFHPSHKNIFNLSLMSAF